MSSRIGRRSSVAIAFVATIAILAMVTPASAAPGLFVAGPGSAASTYYTQQVVVQKGNSANFRNLDIAPHDVRSGTPTAPNSKFHSALIGFGKTTSVIGVNLLPKGSYKFYCSIHHNMKGVLRVI
jgi:plastocyanin